jgi:hypothetical protein
MGIDLFLEKPNTQQEISFFMDCIESLLGREADAGFRGVQSKSLVDIIQLECLSQSSSTLKVTNAALTGKIWFLGGDVIDAETGDLQAEEAFKKILGWRTGSFEILPAEPNRKRAIFSSYQGLLLESAQALDEAQAAGQVAVEEKEVVGSLAPEPPLAGLTKVPGVEFALHVPQDEKKVEGRGIENPERLAGWVRTMLQSFRTLGDGLGAGQLLQIEALGSVNHLVLVSKAGADLCVGFSSSISNDLVRETMPKVLEKWDF